MQVIFFSKTGRTLWSMFYTVSASSLLIAFVLSNDKPYMIPILILGAMFLYLGFHVSFGIPIKYITSVTIPPVKPVIIARPILNPKPKPEIITLRPKPKKQGVIYIMRRSDGILKFGKTINLSTRHSAHEKDYESNFAIVGSWIVSNIDKLEKIALSKTTRYSYKEDNRKELRLMDDVELTRFMIAFTDIVSNDWSNAIRGGELS